MQWLVLALLTFSITAILLYPFPHSAFPQGWYHCPAGDARSYLAGVQMEVCLPQHVVFALWVDHGPTNCSCLLWHSDTALCSPHLVQPNQLAWIWPSKQIHIVQRRLCWEIPGLVLSSRNKSSHLVWYLHGLWKNKILAQLFIQSKRHHGVKQYCI